MSTTLTEIAARTRHPETLEQIVLRLQPHGGPWKIFPNPMRADGVFVAQDIPCFPYPGVKGANGLALYPAIPQNAKSVGYQLPHVQAKQLLAMLNEDS